MKFLTGILFLFLLLGFKEKNPPVQATWSIPQQTFSPWADMELSLTDSLTVDEFVITKQVTLGEYRKYLEAVKRDSSEAYYESQLPDSTMCAPSAYKKYIRSHKYDGFPVCSVTWLSAMNYCRWKAKQDQLPDSMMYNLPNLEQWLAAYRYLNAQQTVHDLNRDYSDWLQDAFDESAYEFLQDMHLSYAYDEWPNDPPVMRRKRFIGNSFHHQHDRLGGFMSEYGYSFHGYAYIGFRMVKMHKPKPPGMKKNGRPVKSKPK